MTGKSPRCGRALVAIFLPRSWLAAALLALFAVVHLTTGAAPRDSAAKAAFLYKFGAFVEWPAGTFRGPKDPLVIGVLGDEAVTAELEQLAGARRDKSRPVQVRGLAEHEAVAGVHMLFVGPLRPVKLQELLSGLSGPVLVVTQQEGALRHGSVINFVTDGERLRFAASVAAAEARRLRLSARLLAVAHSVEGKPR